MSPHKKDNLKDGLSRIRAAKVMRRMRYLTGMSAIGGFLFGYDTGMYEKKIPFRTANVFLFSPLISFVVVLSLKTRSCIRCNASIETSFWLDAVSTRSNCL